MNIWYRWLFIGFKDLLMMGGLSLHAWASRVVSIEVIRSTAYVVLIELLSGGIQSMSDDYLTLPILRRSRGMSRKVVRYVVGLPPPCPGLVRRDIGARVVRSPGWSRCHCQAYIIGN